MTSTIIRNWLEVISGAPPPCLARDNCGSHADTASALPSLNSFTASSGVSAGTNFTSNLGFSRAIESVYNIKYSAELSRTKAIRLPFKSFRVGILRAHMPSPPALSSMMAVITPCALEATESAVFNSQSHTPASTKALLCSSVSAYSGLLLS